MKITVPILTLAAALAAAFSIPAGIGTGDGTPTAHPSDPEVQVGDRLFFDSRFSQFFFAHAGGNVNATLAEGDPVMENADVAGGAPLEGPFRGESMNCRNCHFGDDFLPDKPLFGRTYCDFSRRSAIPRRDDGLTVTPRNAPVMIDMSLPRDIPQLLHLDGEFITPEDLVIETMTGRNFGWLPHEGTIASAHIAKVIRGDEGVNPRHVTYAPNVGIPYRTVLLGTDPSLPASLRLPRKYRIDVATASDDQILSAMAALMHAYMDSLRFGAKNTGRESVSPYDLFIEKNKLPAKHDKDESPHAYAQRLLGLVSQRGRLQWVTDEDGEFDLHTQTFQFGPTELQGMKTFFTQPGPSRTSHAGNCIACHTPPQFTDNNLHNNGVSQAEYDGIFGRGAFAAVDVPGLDERNAHFDAYLPPSPKHPKATSRFRAVPSAQKRGFADLGVWNVFANPDMPKPQAVLTQLLCDKSAADAKTCTPAEVLPRTIGLFKTPTIRDLGQSYPYFHSGAMRTIEDVLRFYVTTPALARAGKVRNASPELSGVHIDATDVAPLAAFLRSLNEDYQ